MNKAVFLDRDGTIIREWARKPEDVVLLPGALEALKSLKNAGFLLFLVSNQPDYARGRASMEQLWDIHERFVGLLDGVRFTEYYYCYHAPEDGCPCRKPGAAFLETAQQAHNIDMAQSWMVGDRECDVECGRAAHVSTIKIGPDCDLLRAATIIRGEK